MQREPGVVTRLALLLFLSALLTACRPPSEANTTLSPAATTAVPSPTMAPVPTAAPSAAGCPELGPDLVTGPEVHAVPDLAEPAPRQWFEDPTFGTCLVRLTDRDADPAPDDASPGMVNEYARVQSFNADGSRLLIYGTEGAWYLYDAQTLQPLEQLPLADEPRWDAEDPDLIFYLSETRLVSYRLDTRAASEVHDFARDLPGQELAAVWTRHEGSPSADRRYWGFMAEDGEWLPLAFVVYDRQADQATIRDVRGLPGIEEDVDHVTMSPLGTYFLASFDRACEDGTLGDDAHPCGLMVYDRDLSNGRSLLRIIGHYDPALDARGREVVVFQDIDTDHISMLDLESGDVTDLWSIDYSHTAIGLHFSGLAYERPGWAVVSTHDDDPRTYTWMDDQVFLVELKASGRVVRLAHTHSVVDDEREEDYWAEPHATTNPDLTRILFGSNWGRSGSGRIDTYMIALRADWPERLGP